jgi:hypothetical protein
MRRPIVAVLAVMLAAGCGGSGDDAAEGDDPATTSSTPTPTTPDETIASNSAEAEVEAAYLAYWEMAQRLVEAPNPDDPEIPERATGPAMGQLVDSLSTLRAQNRAVRGGPGYGHRLLSLDVSGGSALVRDCTVDDGSIVDASTGDVIEQRVVTVLLEVSLRRETGGWRVSEIEQLDSWSGATTCS